MTLLSNARLPFSHGLRDEGRHVDQHVARCLVDAHQPLDAGEIALQLPQTLCRAYAERGEVRESTKPRREVRSGPGSGQGRRETPRRRSGLRARVRRQVALDHEPSPDRGDGLVGIARPDRDLVVDDRPTARLHDPLITLDRRLHGDDARLADERCGDLIVRAIALIELGPDLLAARPLIGTDHAAIGEGAKRIERVGTARPDKRERRPGDPGGHDQGPAQGPSVLACSKCHYCRRLVPSPVSIFRTEHPIRPQFDVTKMDGHRHSPRADCHN